jgi:hypothetical protein
MMQKKRSHFKIKKIFKIQFLFKLNRKNFENFY